MVCRWLTVPAGLCALKRLGMQVAAGDVSLLGIVPALRKLADELPPKAQMLDEHPRRNAFEIVAHRGLRVTHRERRRQRPA